MKMLMLSSVFISAMFMMGSHPVVLMLLILMQTSMICVMSWLHLKISWFSFILFLVFLGGLMVLFIYITSLASNEMMKMNFKDMKFMSLMMLLIFLLTAKNFNSQLVGVESFIDSIKLFFNMFSLSSSILIILTMIYLLLTLIVVVKVSSQFNAPIKNTIFKIT